MIFTILFVYPFTLSNASKETSQETMPTLHVNTVVSENNCNKCRNEACNAMNGLVKVKQSPLSASRSLTSPPKNARGSLGAPLTTNNRNIYFFPSSTASPLPSHTPYCLYQVSDPAFLFAGEPNT